METYSLVPFLIISWRIPLQQRSLLIFALITISSWVNCLQISLASRSSRLMSRAKISEIWRNSCARWRILMAEQWEPFGVIPSSVLRIPSLLRSEGRILMGSVSHIPMGTDPIIWYQISANPILKLTIQKLLQNLQLSLRPQVIPIQPRGSSPRQSRHKSEAILGVLQSPLSYWWSSRSLP